MLGPGLALIKGQKKTTTFLALGDVSDTQYELVKYWMNERINLGVLKLAKAAATAKLWISGQRAPPCGQPEKHARRHTPGLGSS